MKGESWFYLLKCVVSLDASALSYSRRTTFCVKQVVLVSVILALSGLAWVPQCC